MDFLERCEKCDGRGFLLPRTPVFEGKTPPRSEWCDKCLTKGYVLTHEGHKILALVRDHLDEFEAERLGTWI